MSMDSSMSKKSANRRLMLGETAGVSCGAQLAAICEPLDIDIRRPVAGDGLGQG